MFSKTDRLSYSIFFSVSRFPYPEIDHAKLLKCTFQQSSFSHYTLDPVIIRSSLTGGNFVLLLYKALMSILPLTTFVLIAKKNLEY